MSTFMCVGMKMGEKILNANIFAVSLYGEWVTTWLSRNHVGKKIYIFATFDPKAWKSE